VKKFLNESYTNDTKNYLYIELSVSIMSFQTNAMTLTKPSQQSALIKFPIAYGVYGYNYPISAPAPEHAEHGYGSCAVSFLGAERIWTV